MPSSVVSAITASAPWNAAASESAAASHTCRTADAPATRPENAACSCARRSRHAARPQHRADDQCEHQRRRGGDRGERERQAPARRGEHLGARLVDRNHPAGHRRVGVRDDVPGGTVQALRVTEHLAGGTGRPLQLRGQRGIARLAEVLEDGLALAVEHHEVLEAEVDGRLRCRRRVHQQGTRQHARNAARGIVRRHGHDDDVLVRAARRHALADERLPLHRLLEVGSIGHVDRRLAGWRRIARGA
jgi:hypothetical protein